MHDNTAFKKLKSDRIFKLMKSLVNDLYGSLATTILESRKKATRKRMLSMKKVNGRGERNK